MESQQNPSLILSCPSPQSRPYATLQSSKNTDQNSNATQSFANQSSRIQFDRGASGGAFCGSNPHCIGVRIGCSQEVDGVYFSGQVVDGGRVTNGDMERFRKGFEISVNASPILANSAIKASTKMVLTRDMVDQDPSATLSCAAKVAAALSENHRKAPADSVCQDQAATFKTMYVGCSVRDKILQGGETKNEMGAIHLLKSKDYNG